MNNFEKTILNFLLDKDADRDELERYLSKGGLDFILEYARANHMLFALASKMDKKRCLEQSDALRVKQILEDENNQYLELVSLAKQAQNIFDENNYHVVLMKCFFPFPYTDDDLDFVTVQKGGFSRCKKALEESNFMMIKNRSYLREPLKRFFSVQGNICLVHLHSAFSWNGVRYADSKTVWEDKAIKKIDEAAFCVPSPTYDFLITAGHALFENKCVYMSDFINVITLVKSKQVNWNELLQMANEVNWKSGLLCFLAQIEAIYKKIYSVPLLPQDTPRGKDVCVSDRIIFPFVLKRTFPSSFKKFFLDITKFRFRQIPRQLFSYTIVDYCLYRRIVNHKDRLENLYVDFFQRN